MTVHVVGSINIDIIARVETLPGPGETVLALGAERLAGGKGANQAAAAARSRHPKLDRRMFDETQRIDRNSPRWLLR